VIIAMALVASLVLAALSAMLRFGVSSLLRTSRADALRDAAAGMRGAAQVAGLLEDPRQVRPAVGVVHSALLVAAAIPAAWALSATVSGLALFVSLVALAAVLVFGGEAVPRRLGRVMPRRPAYLLYQPLAIAIRLGSRTVDANGDDQGGTDQAGEPATPEDKTEEIALISSVLEFSDAIVREVMVPRPDMVTISGDQDSARALEMILASGRSRIPVTGDDLDDVLGVVYARDLLRFQDSGAAAASVQTLMRPAHFVPETKKVFDLLRELQREKVHLAIVVDEYGGTAGLVTIEDLLEEIVGEIADEYDTEERMIEESEQGYLVDGRLSVEDLAALVGMPLPDENWDTVGGLILGLAGRVPEEGETFQVDGVQLTAERVQGRRVARVRVSVG
jgi:CBS domain containing-hemolysin-like protein